jgi:hypothetical protein
MTSLTLPAEEARAVRESGVRQPDRDLGAPRAETRTLEWDTDLTPAELQAVADVQAIARAGAPMTTEAYAAVRAQMQVLRDLRQLGRNAFMALTAADRDRMIYDALVTQTIIDLAILRDE